MKDNLENLVNLFSLINKQINPETMPEASAALADAAKKLIEKSKIVLNQILVGLEKDITEGKITDQELINKIKDYRDKYNAL